MTTPTNAPSRQLSLFDSTNIIVGIIIGVGVYQMAPAIASGIGPIRDFLAPWLPFLSPESVSRLAVLLLWVVGGLISLFGALGYAELASAFPRAGGDYVYLSRAYGRWAGYLFGWVQLSIVRPGDITVMALAFATYALQVSNPSADALTSPTGKLLACGAVVFLTIIHILGVRQGKWTQNLLTVAKAVGLLVIAIVAFSAKEAPAAPAPGFQLPWATALVLVLFTYGGLERDGLCRRRGQGPPSQHRPRIGAGYAGGDRPVSADQRRISPCSRLQRPGRFQGRRHGCRRNGLSIASQARRFRF